MIAGLVAGVAWAGAVDALPSVVGHPGQPPEQALLTDLDGDGEIELTVGIPSSDRAGHESGEVAWIPFASALAPLTPLDDAATVILTGEAPQDHAATSLAAVGDLDGDGYPDLALGAPDASSEAVAIGGRVYVVYGGALPATLTASLGDGDAWHGIDRIAGAEPYGRLGERVYGAPDLTDDGRDDLLLAAPIPTPNGLPGTGWLGLWRTEPRGFGESTVSFSYAVEVGLRSTEGLEAAWAVGAISTLAGRSATTIPDVSGDGRPEILLGAPGVDAAASDDDTAELHADDPSGAAYLFYGTKPGSGTIADEAEAEAVVAGEHEGDALPWLLDVLPSGEILFAAPEHGAGAIYLFDTLELSVQTSADAASAIHAADAGDLFGRGVGDASGLTADSFLLVGAPGHDGGRGSVVLVGHPEGHALLGDVELGRIDGCWTDGELGHTVSSFQSAGGPVLAFTVPFASVLGEADGLAAFLDVAHLAAFDAACTHTDATTPDADGDGTPTTEDCDDEAAWRYPGAPEVCGDGKDDDCDGAVDEDCGEPSMDPGCGCSGPRTLQRGRCPQGGGGAVFPVILLAILCRRRVASLGLLVASMPARAEPLDAVEGATYRLWGSVGSEYLQGPVLSGTFAGEPALVVANPQGMQYTFGAGEVALLPAASLERDVWLGDAAVTYFGATQHDYLGASVGLFDEGGDAPALYVGVDHTGLTEIEVGQVVVFRDPLADGLQETISVEGAAYVLDGEDDGDAFGATMAVRGDLDGDGRSDLVVAAPTMAWGRTPPTRPEDCEAWIEPLLMSGIVYVIHGGLTDRPADPNVIRERVAVRERCDPNTFVADESVATAAITAWDPNEATFFGHRVLSPGDLDGDGTGDLLVTSLDADFGGTVHFFPGPIEEGSLHLTLESATGRWSSTEPELYLGWSLTTSPDGATIALGTPWASDGAGAVWIQPGPPEGTVELRPDAVVLKGEAASGFGSSLAWGEALLVGAPYAGEVHVFDASLETLAVLGGVPSLGHWVGWVDDVAEGPDESEAVDDVVLVAPEASFDLTHQGVALVLSGARVLSGDLPELASSDVDGDGDGVAASLDCDDKDPGTSPLADERCGDGLDNDCDTATDEEPCTRGCGCRSNPGSIHPGSLGALALLVGLRRRRRILLAVPAFVACRGPDLDLQLRDPATNEALDPLHLAGTVQLSARGDFERLALDIDGATLQAGAGPYLRVDWAPTVDEAGPHELEALGYRGAREPERVSVAVVVDPSFGDAFPPDIAILRPPGTTVAAGQPLIVGMEATDDRGLSTVEIRLDGAVLVRWIDIAARTFVGDTAIEGLLPGVHILAVTATDLAGHAAVAERTYEALAEPEAGKDSG